MGSILSRRRIFSRFRRKHFCGAISFHAGSVDVDLARLRFCLEIDRKPMGGVFGVGASRVVGPVPTLRAAMSLLRAEHAAHLLAVLDFF